MKARESGMPDESQWESLFDVEGVLTRVGPIGASRDVVEFGCGYGTFTIPVARRVAGVVHAIDIEREMVERTERKAQELGIRNVAGIVRDFVTEGVGLGDETVDYAMLFNILHASEPGQLLREAWRVLRNGGRVGIIHWRFDASTPRGPSMDIRPKPEECERWAVEAGFDRVAPGIIELPPFHVGMVLRKSGA